MDLERYLQNQLKEIQDFVDKEGVKSPTELKSKNKRLYNSLNRYNLFRFVSWYYNNTTINKEDLVGQVYLTEQNQLKYSFSYIKDFCKDRSITGPANLYRANVTAYSVAYSKGWFEGLFSIPEYGSSWEKEVADLLNEKKIDYLMQADSYSKFSKLDFYIPKFETAIEVQGPRHFVVINSIKRFIECRKSDLKKRNWCKENGIKLLYYVPIHLARKGVNYNNFISYVYTNKKELVNDILKHDRKT